MISLIHERNAWGKVRIGISLFFIINFDPTLHSSGASRLLSIIIQYFIFIFSDI